MKLSVTGYLIAALVVVAGWSAFATQRWWSASARCDTRIEALKGKAAREQAEAVSKAQAEAAGIFATEAATMARDLAAAAGNTSGRATQFIHVPVTGACVMPPGLPSLQPAVEEARRAALD